jgi:LmbE family N-acetylglucosaminyl deacetylase
MKRLALIGTVSLLLAISAMRAGSRNAYPLPEERGTAGIFASLQKLPVYARVLETTAHPDDENSGTLTWLSRKYHAQTALFCLTRGEGGQNILGPEKYDALGLLRTGELREACRYYGTDLYFGKVLDFGFSKTAEETLSKWGHQKTLEDMVQFIRQWRPTVLISRFQGSAADGHGHHQAAGILTREAFLAAADPNKFPEQLNGGLQPWLVKKFYISIGMPGEPASTGTARVPVGDYDPTLGLSYREIAAEGYSRHRSQGNGAGSSLPGIAYEYFRPADSASGIQNRDKDFFDSIGTSLNSILDLAGSEKNTVLFLLEDLAATEKTAMDAIGAFKIAHPENSAAAAARGVAILTRSIEKVESSAISPAAKAPVLQALRAKLLDFQNAASAVLGIYMVARSEDLTGTPGEKEQVTVYFYNRGSEPVKLKKLTLATDAGTVTPANTNPGLDNQAGGSTATHRFTVEIGRDAKGTEQFWHLQNSGEARYKTSPTADEFAPFGEPEVRAEAVYVFRDIEIPIRAIVQAQAGNQVRGADFTEFQIVPALSLVLNPDYKIAPILPKPGEYEFRISVLNNLKSGSRGTLKLLASSGWSVRPAEAQFALSRKGETYSAGFFVQVPAGAKPGDYPVQAIATVNGREYRNGYQVISYPENWTRNFYLPARSKIEVFDIKTTSNLTVGYIPGAGDEIPEAIEQLGVKLQTISASELALGDLSRFSAIVTGIRAYNVNEDLKANNQRILDYVNRGGTLIVQYVRPEQARNAAPSFPFGPYPMTVSDSERITVEDSPIKILDPSNPIFNQPNKISEADFQGWVQERGLYFMSKWDSQYQALLSGHDPGEESKMGGMLISKYGKGNYIYTGYAWFRQLPAGVPGAFRIFANMISLGRRQ